MRPIVLSITAAAILCLSSAVHYEAGGESTRGKVAVASVIMNRVESKRFPNSVCGVVKQRRQFSWYPRKPLTLKEKEFARKFLEGKTYKRTVPGSYFFTTKRVRLNRPHTTTIGGHRFYGL